MRLKLTLVLTTSILCTSTVGSAQTERPDGDTPVVRISYGNWYVGDWSERQSSRICFALYDGGYYQRVTLTKNGSEEALHGTMVPSEVSRLRKLVKAFDVNSSGPGGVREGSESLIVDIVHDRGANRHEWVDRDRQDPFPDSAVRIVHWLQNFRAEGAEVLTLRELGEQRICPPGSLKPLQPALSDLLPARR